MDYTREELERLNEIDPPFAKAIKESPAMVTTGDFPFMRSMRAAHLAKVYHLLPISGPIPEVNESYRQIPVRDGTTIRIKIYTPANPKADKHPLIVQYHEGGFCMGGLEDEDLNCRMFCRDLDAICVNVEYRLAPEHTFPIPIDDSWDALQWIGSHASELGADPSIGFIVGGGSAGGNIAAVLAHAARDFSLSPPLTGNYLCVPALLSPHAVPEKWKAHYRSRQESVDDPILKDLGRSTMIEDTYKPDEGSWWYNVLNHEKGHGSLPPTYMQVGGMDPLRDEALIYEKELKDNSVKVKVDMYAGHGHYFWTNFPALARGKEFINDTRKGVRWLLEQSGK
ncbi:alpha/beta-hydrolase [Aulographum hederae CBS 113979]|uniref:Alpha/beta-hydrolase n=1 Tax=Aulographum hederae CBS 113979 TaxID=1176131 RepID=A0A6G1H5Z1_9PEZI|nr:alpha/beta-hydrolase [Aulographum hederae CBS 113979]